MSIIRVMGIDPGFGNVGISIIDLPGEVAAKLTVIYCTRLKTKKTTSKKTVFSASDLHERTKLIAQHLNLLLDQYKPRLIITEGYSPVRSASSTAMQGRFFGILGTFSALRALPVLEVPPKDVKGILQATSKKAVEELVRLQATFTTLAEESLAGVAPSERNHVYDSIGAVVAARMNTALQFMFSSSGA